MPRVRFNSPIAAMSAAFVMGVLPSVRLASASDWPQWRFDAGRTATTAASLDPAGLKVKWVRQLPALEPAFHDTRLHFDRGYEPVVANGRLFLSSSHDESITAYDAGSGEEKWKFYTEGPVRFAPAVSGDRVIAGSDDGHLYGLDAVTGELRWKFRAVPSQRNLLGNRRLISVWPVRGGPVVRGGRVYFAAGVWSFEGVFVYCLDAATGEVIWLNDSAGYVYGQHPHNAEAFGGLAPQGYLLFDDNDLIVPCSNAYPARFDSETGSLKEFALPSPGRKPGGWFASTPEEKEKQKLRRRGLLFDSAINVKQHEDKPHAEGLPNIRTTIRTSDHEWRFESPPSGIKGEVHSMIVASGNLYATTLDGRLFCLGNDVDSEARVWSLEVAVRRGLTKSEAAEEVRQKLGAGKAHGHAVALGLDRDAVSLIDALAAATDLTVVGFDRDRHRLTSLRRHYRKDDLQGHRVSLRRGEPRQLELPPYFATLIIADASVELDADALGRVYQSLRPFGGLLALPRSGIDLAALIKTAGLDRAQLSHGLHFDFITRTGALEGSSNYTGEWSKSDDALVRSPVGVLWFDDTLGHFKRSPQPKFIDGVMISQPKKWRDSSRLDSKLDYRLLPAVFSDVYTGRVFEKYEVADLRRSFGENEDLDTVQPSQYRPPNQKNDWKPEAPRAGTRANPLTGETEPRIFPRSYGCDGGFDYGSIYSMRSGTAAFYDKQGESGTINISGPRSGCTNSVIPANGLLNVPYYYEGCTCAYPLPTGLALVSMPATHEQWMAWGEMEAEELSGKIQRLGINLGAPGDRVTPAGTLWVDYPSVGGPSPQIEVASDPPEAARFYHHSVWIEGGEGWPWVAASGVDGLHGLTISGLKPGVYTVRLTFAEFDARVEAGDRVFGISLQGTPVWKRFDPLAAAGARRRAVTLGNDAVDVDQGVLRIRLDAVSGRPMLGGVEIIRQGLKTDAPVRLD